MLRPLLLAVVALPAAHAVSLVWTSERLSQVMAQMAVSSFLAAGLASVIALESPEREWIGHKVRAWWRR